MQDDSAINKEFQAEGVKVIGLGGFAKIGTTIAKAGEYLYNAPRSRCQVDVFLLIKV